MRSRFSLTELASTSRGFIKRVLAHVQWLGRVQAPAGPVLEGHVCSGHSGGIFSSLVLPWPVHPARSSRCRPLQKGAHLFLFPVESSTPEACFSLSAWLLVFECSRRVTLVCGVGLMRCEPAAVCLLPTSPGWTFSSEQGLQILSWVQRSLMRLLYLLSWACPNVGAGTRAEDTGCCQVTPC